MSNCRTPMFARVMQERFPGSMVIKEVAILTGVIPATIRMWELRYGWPKPERAENGYRVYLKQTIEDLQHCAGLWRSGISISTLIENGCYVGRRLLAKSEAQGPAGELVLPQADAALLPLHVREALRCQHVVTITNALASLYAFEPKTRAAIVRCVQAANKHFRGCFRAPLERFISPAAARCA